MKRWSSVVLALALLAIPPFIKAELVTEDGGTAVSEAVCCCCSPNQKHTGAVTCKCDGCAQKEAQRCSCVSTALSPAGLPVLSASNSPLPLSGRVVSVDLLYFGRTDSPLLRPPIFS